MRFYKILMVASVMGLSLFACGGGAATEAPAASPVLPPALGDVDFPPQVVAYPRDWPADLRYPDQFQPADFSTGVLPDGNQTSWTIKLRGPGSPAESAAALSAFFAQNGWEIAEQSDLDAGGILLIVQDKNGGGGLLVIDADPQQAGQSLILAMVNR
jgi:hypothetical protein